MTLVLWVGRLNPKWLKVWPRSRSRSGTELSSEHSQSKALFLLFRLPAEQRRSGFAATINPGWKTGHLEVAGKQISRLPLVGEYQKVTPGPCAKPSQANKDATMPRVAKQATLTTAAGWYVVWVPGTKPGYQNETDTVHLRTSPLILVKAFSFRPITSSNWPSVSESITGDNSQPK